MSQQLVRPKTGRMIAGVCAGIARYFNINPVWVRLGFVFTLAPGGIPGLLLYVILWAIMPNEGQG